MAMAGMPNLPSGFKGLVTAGTDAAISLGGAALIRAVFGEVWGLVNEFGVPILLSDSVKNVDYTNSSTISKFLIEKGSFSSYNKVTDPRFLSVQLIKWKGTKLEKSAWLAQLEALANSTLKFHVVTPEYLYRNYNITRLAYMRDNTSIQMITASIDLEEVREVQLDFGTQEAKAEQDNSTVEGGTVQPKEASQSMLSKLAGKFNL